MDTYTFRYKDVTRVLPVYTVESGAKIAYLDTLSDFELVTALSRDVAALIEKGESYRAAARVTLLTAESKGVPFAYSVASFLSANKPVEIVIARKREKKFFGACKYADKTSITSEQGRERLLVTEDDANRLCGATVVLLDDVYSTGASMNALAALAETCGAKVIDTVAAIWETADESLTPPVSCAATLPLILPVPKN